MRRGTRSAARGWLRRTIGIVLFALCGSAQALTVSPTSHAFGNTLVGTSAPVRLTTVRELSAASRDVASVLESCPAFSRAVFTVYTEDGVALSRSPTTFPATLYRFVDLGSGMVVEQFLEVELTFTPAARGLATCPVTVNASGGLEATITLTGTGIAPVLQLGPSSLTFANRRIGTDSPGQGFTVSNNGDAGQALTIVSTAVTPNASDWIVVFDAATPIAPGASRNGTVVFLPTAAGSRNASLTVTSDDPVTPARSLTLIGSGLTATVGAAPTELAFDDVTMGSEAVRSLTVSNTTTVAGAPLQVSGVSFGGAHAGDFRLTSPALPLAIAPGTGVTFDVACRPSAPGARAATMTIDTDADNVPQDPQVGLACTGVAAPDPVFGDGFE